VEGKLDGGRRGIEKEKAEGEEEDMNGEEHNDKTAGERGRCA
jgi:hypothetical protein